MTQATAKGPSVKIAVADLKRSFFVRKDLDPERVTYFVDLYKSGAEVPPIEVFFGTTDIFDGRHRHEALVQMGAKMADCTYVKKMSTEQKYVEAFGRNFGGALPPTRVDTVFTMRQMLEQGVKQSRVKALFSPRFYKPSYADKLLKDARGQIAEAKVARAAIAVLGNNLTVKAAAEKYEVDVSDLKAKLSGKKAAARDSTSIPKMKSEISNRFRGSGKRTTTVIQHLLDMYQDGETTKPKVLDVIDHVEKLLKRQIDGLANWRDRLKALEQGVKRSAKG